VQAAIISTGEELLTGETTDTNSAWISESLWAQGVDVRCMLTAGDALEELCWAIEQATSRSSIVVCTGGLGPTVDDRTAEAVAVWAGVPLEKSMEAMAQIEERYRRRGRDLNAANRKQAHVPKGAEILENHWGSAPGFVFNHQGCRVFCVPGVPLEMRKMFERYIADAVRVEAPPVLVRIRTFGCAESRIAELLEGVDLGGATLGFRAHIPEVQVKLRFEADVPEATKSAAVERVCSVLERWVYNVDGGDLAQTVVSELRLSGETVCLAESCTAGMISAWLADVPGASAVLNRAVVVYSNEAKQDLLAVSAESVDAHGAVSEVVAKEMAKGALDLGGSTWAVSVTGIAGPGGGSTHKPVGTVHIAVAGPTGTHHQHAVIPGSRSQVRKRASGAALALLLRARRG
jgi:nicotinamide-nucleotide amidase